MSLLECLRQVDDPRRAEGQRTRLEDLFVMVTLGYLCGCQGYRPLGTFVQAHAEFFRELLHLKHPPPSYVTLREVLTRVDSTQLIAAFNQWAGTYENDGEWLCGDGKALAATVQDEHGAGQDFASVVSIFSQRSGLVRRMATYRHAQGSEIDVLRQLVQDLTQRGAILTVDALHTQKNAGAHRTGRSSLSGAGQGQSTQAV